MAQTAIEERVAKLEREVAELKAALSEGSRAKDWRSTLGMFSGDEVMKQIDEEARKIREADRERARRRYSKRNSRKREPARK
jgi:hypothetical protein